MRAASKLPDKPLRRSLGAPAMQLSGLLTAAVFLFPLVYLTGAGLSQGGLVAGLFSWEVAGPLARSLILATSTATAATVLGVGLAWLVMRTDVPAARLWRVVVALPLVLPSYVAAASLRSAFGQGGLVGWVARPSGFWGSIVVLTAVTYPYVYLPVATRLNTLPSSLEDAARLLGDSSIAATRRIVLPQLRHAIGAGSLIVFLYALSDFGAVSLMRYDTLTRAIYASRLADRATALSLGLLLGLTAIAIALVARRSSLRGGTLAALGSPRIYRLGRNRVWVSAVLSAVAGLTLVAPVAVFSLWWLRGVTSVSTIGASVSVLPAPALRSALAGLAAGVAAMVLLLPAAYLVARRRSASAGLLDVTIASAFALPGLVIALSVVYWVLAAPQPVAGLYQSFPLLVLVYVVHFGVQSHRASVAAVQGLPAGYDEAAQVLGVGRLRRFTTIELPLIGPGVVAGGGLVMLSTLKELPATLLLAPTGFDTLATRVWGAAEDGFLAEVGITSLALIALSGILTWFFVLRPAKLGERQERAAHTVV